VQRDSLQPCFSNYFSSRYPNKATEHTEGPQNVRGKSNTKLNTSTCLSSMYLTRKKSTANLKLIGNLIAFPETLTPSVASSAD